MSFGVRLILALGVSLGVTVLASLYFIPLLRKKKIDQHVRDDGPKSHLSKEGTPTMGGVMMLCGLLTSLVFAILSEEPGAHAIAFLLVATFGFALIGFLDDAIKLWRKRSLGLRAWQKIVLQLAVSFGVSWFACNLVSHAVLIPFSRNVVDLGGWYIPFSMFVFIATVNSVNLTDGLDGLATSLVMVNGAAYLAIIILLYPALLLVVGSNLQGTDAVIANTAVYTCSLIGACIGFLFFNRHPAKVFMGDTGSFALGGALTAIATALGLQLLILIMGFMYVLSAVSVIIQVGSFKLRHKRVFRMAPLHHHFELGGMPETRVVAMYTTITVVLSLLAVLSATFI